MAEVCSNGFGQRSPISWSASGVVSSSVTDRAMSEGSLNSVEVTDSEPRCGESVEPPASSTSGFEPLGYNAQNKQMVRENEGEKKEDFDEKWISSEHEVSTSIVDERDSIAGERNNRPVLRICSSPSEQIVTCSSGVDDEESVEKEDGEITGDGLENCDRDRGLSSEDNLWNSEAVPAGFLKTGSWDQNGGTPCHFHDGEQGVTGGELWKSIPLPVKPGSPVERGVILSDAGSQEPRGMEDLVRRLATPEDEDGTDGAQVQEPMHAEKSKSELSKREQVSNGNFVREQPNESETKNLSPLSSSDSQEQPVSQSSQLGTKRKVDIG